MSDYRHLGVLESDSSGHGRIRITAAAAWRDDFLAHDAAVAEAAAKTITDAELDELNRLLALN